MRKWKVALAGSAAGLLVGVLGASPASAAAVFPPNNSQDWIRIGGSDTTYFLMQDLSALYNGTPGCLVITPNGVPQNLDGRCADQDGATPGLQLGYELDGAGNPSVNPATNFQANADHDMAFNAYPVGSSNGITQLTNRGAAGFQVIDVARSSRARRPADNANLRFFSYAKDAIPVVKFPGAPAAAVNNLTQAQVENIYKNCTVNDWGQVGGSAGQPIVVWAAQNGSGTRATFDGFITGDSTTCIPAQFKDGNQANGEHVIFENDANPIVASPDTANSIFYYSLGRHTQTGGETSILLDLNGVAPTEPNVVSGAFAYSRELYNVIRNSFGTGDASNGVRNFVANAGFLCKPAGDMPVNPQTHNNYRVDIENAIRRNGFFPLTLVGGSYCRTT